MKPYSDDHVTLYHGDCLDVLRTLPDASVDSVVTDPPAGISFMGKDWDGHKGGREQWSAWLADVMREAYRVTKPGGHALVWALPRTSHWTACGLEDAGWEIRDKIVHLFGSGFPKSLDVSKAIDKAAGAERGIEARSAVVPFGSGNQRCSTCGRSRGSQPANCQCDTTGTPATPDAERWQGWGTALKPAAEDWWLARKPLTSTVAANVLEHGTGALNIDACRVGDQERVRTPKNLGSMRLDGCSSIGELRDLAARGAKTPSGRDAQTTLARAEAFNAAVEPQTYTGRWPTNVVLDDSQAAELDEQSGELSHNPPAKWRDGTGSTEGWGNIGKAEPGTTRTGFGDTGGASRFFPTFRYEAKAPKSERPKVNGTAHPTVKPLDLMRWLVRLVTPPGGVVLEPFAGSGTTVEAAIIEGFHCIAIEREADYLPLIMQRVNRRRDPVAAIRQTGGDLGLFEMGDLA